jgi:hypothetical protein
MCAETELFDEKQQLFDLMFQKLGDKCKEVLQLSFSLQFMEEVAKTECNLLCPQEEILCTGQSQWIQETNRFKSLKN